MMSTHVRLRFAPSPTGIMHLGNIRAALINYLFARQKKGTFLIRIEDTDPQRNTDPAGKQILADLAWLGLNYDEGPDIGGPYAPYLQSERSDLYQEHLKMLLAKNLVYRCFCTTDELEKKRLRQIALKMPPRYDRHCLKLSAAEVEKLVGENTPYIWRFALPDKEVDVIDLARGTIAYNLKNFSDFPLTRQDGSFTFVFANFVDDLLMKISHIFRGEEHISSTALQAALYQAFDAPIPVFWHLPIICNAEGKKLSKRDFGFSLHDLQREGFLPQAIVNYLAILGGSFEQEIMPLTALTDAINFEKDASAGFIKYDVEKLRWLNHKWMCLLPIEQVAQLCKAFLEKEYPAAANMSALEVAELIKPIREELVILSDSVKALKFYFEKPVIEHALVEKHNFAAYHPLLHKLATEYNNITSPDELLEAMKALCKDAALPLKDFFILVRIALTGNSQGIGIKELLHMLPHAMIMARIEHLLHAMKS